jgi:hypothetical protein
MVRRHRVDAGHGPCNAVGRAPTRVRALRFAVLTKAISYLRPDAAVRLVLVTRIVQFASTPITLLLVATRFSSVTQGFYYTFTTITAWTMVLELGLGMVLTQFASQEFAHLRWDASALAGEDGPLRHLMAILVKACRWYVAVALIAIVVFVPGGLAFFRTQAQHYDVDYATPWIALVVLTAFGLMAIPLVSVIEGCGQVVDVTRLRLAQTATANGLLWLGILTGQALYAPAMAAVGPVIVPAIWFGWRYRGLLRQVRDGFGAHMEATVSWRRELFPMQWRIAVSWLAGFLVFSLFNPLLFRYQGAVVAGQMGMSLQLAAAPYLVGMSWLMTRAPRYGTLVRQRRWDELDTAARTGTVQALLVWLAGSVALLLVVAAAKAWLPALGNRVLSVAAVAALCIANLVNICMQSMASYLRAHKAEPYVGISVTTGVLVATVCWVTARSATPLAMAIGYAAVTVIVELPIAAIIFVEKRRQWHAVPV